MNYDITGIILSGGESRRMGKDKGLVKYRGRELVLYSISILKLFCDRILISSNNIDEYETFGYDVIPDLITGIGPMGGVYSCLIKSKTEMNFILSCDMPLINSEVFEAIIPKITDYQIIVPKHNNGFMEPLAGYYSQSVLPIIEDSLSKQDYKLLNLFQKVRLGIIDTEQLLFGAEQFTNMNSPKDLIR